MACKHPLWSTAAAGCEQNIHLQRIPTHQIGFLPHDQSRLAPVLWPGQPKLLPPSPIVGTPEYVTFSAMAAQRTSVSASLAHSWHSSSGSVHSFSPPPPILCCLNQGFSTLRRCLLREPDRTCLECHWAHHAPGRAPPRSGHHDYTLLLFCYSSSTLLLFFYYYSLLVPWAPPLLQYSDRSL